MTSETRIIIAGSRTFNDYSLMQMKVDEIIKENKYDPTTIRIISGTASGADSMGEKYSKLRNYWLTRIPAQWDRYRTSAGYKRNECMAKFASNNNNLALLIVFWDGKSVGTKNMINIAKRFNIRTYVVKF